MDGVPWQGRDKWRLLALAAGCVLLLVLALSPAAVAKKGLTGRAERIVSAKVGDRSGDRVRVSCARRRSSRRSARRWLCSWSRLRVRARACRGTHRVSLRQRRWRLVQQRIRCAAARPVTKQPSSSASTGSARQPFLFGFNDSSVRNGWASAVQDATLNAEVGTTVSRVGVGWRWAEPRKGHYDLKAFDDQYRELLARGIRPLWFPTFAPDWATETGKPCDATKKLCHFPPGRAHIADYASFVAMLARRYPKSAGIEVWNEPNQKFFWQPYPDPVLYADMLKATYLAVKAVNPSMPVVNGGLADNTSYDYGIPPKPYAEAMYANGLKSYMDGFAFHPYPHLTGLFDQTVADMRAVRHAAGDDAKPFWITESGWTTTGHLSGWPASWILTEAQQATSLVALYRRIYAMPDVRAFMVHTLIEPPGNRDTSPGVGYGVVHADLTPKPAFCALAVLRGKPSPCR